MAALLGQAKTLQTNNTKLKNKMKELVPHINPTDDLAKVFTEGEFSLGTKKGKDEAAKKIKGTLAERFGLKINDIALQGLIESVGNDAIQLEFVVVRDEDIEQMMEQVTDKMAQKLRYAVLDMDKIGIRITLQEESCVCLFMVKLDADTIWYAVDLGSEESGILSPEDCTKINDFVTSALCNEYPNAYPGIVTGPKGGTLELGAVYSKIKKETEDKIHKDMSGGCFIEY